MDTLIDADERVTPELKQEVLEVLKRNPSEAGFEWAGKTISWANASISVGGGDKVIRLLNATNAGTATKRPL